LLQTNRVRQPVAPVVCVCDRAKVTAVIRSRTSGAKCVIHVLEYTRRPSSSRRRANTIIRLRSASQFPPPLVSRPGSRRTENRFVTSILYLHPAIISYVSFTTCDAVPLKVWH